MRQTVRPTLKLASHQAFTVAFRSGNLAVNCLQLLKMIFRGKHIRIECDQPGHENGKVRGPGGSRPDPLHHADQVGEHLAD